MPHLSAGLLWNLRGWADELLSSGGYNVLMETARRELEPGIGISRMDESDFVRFLHLAHLFTAYVHATEVCKGSRPITL